MYVYVCLHAHTHASSQAPRAMENAHQLKAVTIQYPKPNVIIHPRHVQRKAWD